MGGAEMKMGSSSVFLLLVVLCCVSWSWRISALVEEEGPVPVRNMAMVGGVQEMKGGENSVEVEQLGRFAVDEHNKKENALLEFAGVVNAKQQVVAGTLYYLTLEVIDGGKKKLYEAKIWVKPWLNFKQLQEFKPAGDSTPSITPTVLGAKRGD